MNTFSITMVLLTLCFIIELTAGAFSTLYRHLRLLPLDRRLEQSKAVLNLVISVHDKSYTVISALALSRARENFEKAKFLRDIAT